MRTSACCCRVECLSGDAGPLKLPPTGEPVKVTAASVVQYVSAKPEKLTVGNALTVTV